MDRAYLVTGGCGFIGEEIVELLSQQDYIKEVRGFDSVAREEVEKITATSSKTVPGGKCPAHLSFTYIGASPTTNCSSGPTASACPAEMISKKDPVQEDTENVLRACCVLSIPCVIYTSSIAAVGPNTSCEPMFRQRENEDTKYSGEVELPYGKTQATAEKLVFEANGKKLSNGGKLTTCTIHANTMYGEKATFLQELYLLTTASNSVLNYLEPENTERNYTYVGNMAWMHVLATGTLQLKPDLLAGQVDYAYADIPTKRSFLTRHQLLLSMDPSSEIRLPHSLLEDVVNDTSAQDNKGHPVPFVEATAFPDLAFTEHDSHHLLL